MESADKGRPVSARPAWKRWFDGTSMYGFELFMALFGLTIAAIVIDYGLFAFFNYAKGIDNNTAQQAVGEFSLWIVAAMLVWLPLAVGFYLRVRGEQAIKPERLQGRLHKVVVSIHLFVNILIVAGAAFTVLYSLIRMATGAGDMGALDILVRITIPATLMAALHGWLLFVFSRAPLMRRKVFALAFVAVGLLVMVGLLVASFGTVRGAAMDQKRERDLRKISNELRNYYSEKRSLPSALSDLDFEGDDLSLSLDDYIYDRQLGSRYELCTDFALDTRSVSYRDSDEYSTYGNFSSHGKGRECFKLSAGYTYFNQSRFDTE